MSTLLLYAAATVFGILLGDAIWSMGKAIVSLSVRVRRRLGSRS
jgi:hypothetical protein